MIVQGGILDSLNHFNNLNKTGKKIQYTGIISHTISLSYRGLVVFQRKCIDKNSRTDSGIADVPTRF